MKKLDWYIIKKFLGTFFLAILLINVIVIIFDISEKIDDFMENDVPFQYIVFTYYFNFLPYFTNLFLALFTFIAVIFFTSKMASHTEIIAILSGGISFNRLLYPYLISSVFLGMLSFALYNYIIPDANRVRLNFEYEWLGKKNHKFDWNIHIQTDPNTYLYIRNFDAKNNKGYYFSIEKYKNKLMYYKMLAYMIQYDSTGNSWMIKDYFIRSIDGKTEKMRRGAKMDTVLGVKPADFSSEVVDVTALGGKELRAFIEKEKIKGSPNIDFYELELYKRISMPFATIILTLIGVSLSSRKLRGGIGMHLGLGIALSFTYILFNQFASVFSTAGDIPPVIATWIPNIVFIAVAIYLIRKAPK